MSASGKSEIMQDIICHKKSIEIWNALLEGDEETHKNKPLFNIVQSQFEQYVKAGLCPKEQGFQIAEPWNGDLEKAPIMFLSSNPAITTNSDFPRYHSNCEFSWYGKNDKGENIIPNRNNGDGGRDTQNAIDRKDFKNIKCEDVVDFFNKRFLEMPMTKTNIPSVYIIDNNKEEIKSRGVKYWNRMWKLIDHFSPEYRNNHEKNEKYIKGILSNVVSTEIIPFKSMGEKGINEALLDYCWKEYTNRILDVSRAKALFVVGKKARLRFMKGIALYCNGFHGIEDEDLINNENVFICKNKRIFFIDHLSIWGSDENYFKRPCFKNIADDLKEILTDM